MGGENRATFAPIFALPSAQFRPTPADRFACSLSQVEALFGRPPAPVGAGLMVVIVIMSITMTMPATSYILRDIPPDLWRTIKVKAAEQGRSIRDILLELLETFATKGNEP